MDRIEGVPEGYRLGVRRGIGFNGDAAIPKTITFELIPIEQPKQLEAVVSMREQYRTGTLKYWRWE
jgi:hypothetical protein